MKISCVGADSRTDNMTKLTVTIRNCATTDIPRKRPELKKSVEEMPCHYRKHVQVQADWDGLHAVLPLRP